MQNYRALYREKRPETFPEILGQEHIVKILKHQIETGTVSHAYLFCGTRGTGKTTTARILAKAMNCTGAGERPCGVCDNCRAIAEGRFVDVIELDAASNNGVDGIREIRESVNYPPTIGQKKVYIIDEVHMLSASAFNAFLKTLEEPPEHVMFILATTNPEKLPATILSRCMRLDFKRVASRQIRENMRKICEERGVQVTEDALALIAGNADGSVRDSLSLLEQCLSGGDEILDRDTVLSFLGAVSDEFYLHLTADVLEGDISSALVRIDQALYEGKDVRQMMKDWLSHYRNLLIAKFVRNPEALLNVSADGIKALQEQSASIDTDTLNRSIVTLSQVINDARYSTQARTLLEVAVVSIAMGLAYGEAPAVSAAAATAARTKPARAVPASAGRPADPQRDPARKAPPAPAQPDERALIAETESLQAFEPSYGLPEEQVPVHEEPSSAIASIAETESLQGIELTTEQKQTPLQAQEEEKAQLGLDEIWTDLVETLGDSDLRLASALKKSSLAAVSDREFKILTDGLISRRMLERSAETITDAMERITGKRRKMVLRLAGEEEQEDENDLQSIADRASELLGTKVRIR